MFKNLVVFFVSVVALTLGYYQNEWHAAGKKWFIEWQKKHEHVIVARLVQSRQTGVFSYGALPGFGDITTWDVNDSVIEHEYDFFANGGQFKAYWTYDSDPALQSIPFSLLERFAGLAPATDLKLFRLSEAILAATVLGFFLIWILGQFGLTAALVTLAFMLASEWLTLFGANFYWNLWAFYLPLTAFSFYLQRSSKNGHYRSHDVFLLLAGTMLVKCLVTGFEFISTALVMPFTAMFYYALRDRWAWKVFLRRFLSAALSALTGAIVALAVLSAQISSVLGGWNPALQFIMHTFGKRSFGDPANYSGIEAQSLTTNLFSVLEIYWSGRALNLNSVLHINMPGFEITYSQIFALFALFTLLFLLRDRFFGGFPQQKTAYALVVTTWLSALAPLSWFVLFKAHSYIHTQMNFIIWQMPFTLFGFALCGFVLANLFRRTGADE